MYLDLHFYLRSGQSPPQYWSGEKKLADLTNHLIISFHLLVQIPELKIGGILEKKYSSSHFLRRVKLNLMLYRLRLFCYFII